MTKQVYYKYLGTNGTIESPVHLEGIYYIRINVLFADADKILTNGKEKKYSVRVPDEEVDKWREIPDKYN